jgi:hypothetical protein
MVKQRLSKKKLERCRQIGNKPYALAFTRGGWPHYTAECWYTQHDADWVNYKDGGPVSPYIRDGKFMDTDSLACRVIGWSDET